MRICYYYPLTDPVASLLSACVLTGPKAYTVVFNVHETMSAHKQNVFDVAGPMFSRYDVPGPMFSRYDEAVPAPAQQIVGSARNRHPPAPTLYQYQRQSNVSARDWQGIVPLSVFDDDGFMYK
jgi:hypothetical protein